MKSKPLFASGKPEIFFEKLRTTLYLNIFKN